MPPRVLHDAREASRFLLLRGKKLCGLLLLVMQRVEGGDLFPLAEPPLEVRMRRLLLRRPAVRNETS